MLAVLSVTAAGVLALVGFDGSNSPNTPSTVVSAKPAPIGPSPTGDGGSTPRATPSLGPTGGTTASPLTAPPASGPSPGGGADRTNPRVPAGDPGPDPAGGRGGGSPGGPAAIGPPPGAAPAAAAGPSSAVAPFPGGSQIQFPSPGAVDWVLFGTGWNGVQSRAAGSSLIGVSIVPVGIAFSSSGFAWSNGTPAATGTNDNDRLRIAGPARLTVPARATPSTLDVYVGSSSRQIEVTVQSVTGQKTFVHQLPSAGTMGSTDGVVSIELPAGTAPTSVLLSAGGLSSWTLAAAVLR